ncbi:hypothetical protein EDB80DRAFT_701248 [Ilyonectria destructans]|nr:hypothetical protein EDB80DRAFT_701248 [Ilyonectria destructans]
MASIEQMTAYAEQLDARTDENSKNKRVTEICIFKLLPKFANDHAAVTAEFDSNVATHCKPGSPYARGIRKIAWGFSPDDPAVFVWMLDWDKIQDHWEFWKTQGFPPVMAAIAKLFQPGRPLVRHYGFGDEGMLESEITVARVMVWDDTEEGKQKQRARELGNSKGKKARHVREGYAVDVDETSWWCSLLGYETEADARADVVHSGDGNESYIVHLEYA